MTIGFSSFQTTFQGNKYWFLTRTKTFLIRSNRILRSELIINSLCKHLNSLSNLIFDLVLHFEIY